MPDVNEDLDLVDRQTGKRFTERVRDNGDGTFTREVYVTDEGGGAPLPAGSNLIGQVVSAPIVSASVSVTRPANITAYSAGQIVNHATSGDAPLAFTGATRVPGGNSILIGAKLSLKTNYATPPTFQLLLFTSAPVNTNNSATGPNDAQVLGLTSADTDALIPGGLIAMGTPTVVDATASPNGALVYMPVFNPLGVALPSGSTVYGLLVVTSAFIPVSTAVYAITLVFVWN